MQILAQEFKKTNFVCVVPARPGNGKAKWFRAGVSGGDVSIIQREKGKSAPEENTLFARKGTTKYWWAEFQSSLGAFLKKGEDR
jgi:hypothetical protein